ncbi:MAG TPA: hypothetical protein PKU91_04245, partial [Phycisphaerales bacterium]|nr:hypothetical protein [Phycisphaerales bacterium]
MRRTSSAARIVWLFMSNARWVRMSSINSRVGSTLEASRNPWSSRPRLSVAGFPPYKLLLEQLEDANKIPLAQKEQAII